MDERPVDLEGPPRYLLVDEYQDLNACDLAVIQSLSRQGCEIYAAGDDDQSIYGFRYANPYGIRRFPDEYVPHALLELNVCQRCGQGILDYALYVAMQDHRRIEKPIHAKPDAPVGQVHVLGFPNQYQEARGIAKICKWLIGAQGILPKDVLVLLRSDRNEVFSGPIRDALTNVQVPVSIASDPLALFNTSPGRQVIAMLRLVHDLTDDLAWRSILATRKNGLSETAFAGLYDLSRRLGRRYSVTLQEVLAEPRLVPRMGGRIAREVTAVGEIVRRVGPPTEGDLQGWLQALITATLGPDEAGPHVLALLLRLGGTAEADTLEGILKSVALSLGEVEQERQSDAVSIMTMHQAKGLTARAVVVAAAEDEYLPGKAQGEEIDDERRLLYVSLTRAMTHLYVTFCNRRFGRQRRTGRTAGEGRTDRTFTTFLRGGPVTPVDGQGFTTSLGT
jgi:DNA helicase-2/ATP-dependent DNA helicase PcrA